MTALLSAWAARGRKSNLTTSWSSWLEALGLSAMAVLVLPTLAAAQTITEYAVTTSSSGPFGVAAGPDGNLWFAEIFANKIGRITTAGIITEYRCAYGR